MYQIFAILIGVLITVMITVNGTLDSYTGNFYSLLIIHIIGLLGVIVTLVVTKQKVIFKEKIPWYLFIAGVIGVFVVFSNNICIQSLGVTLTVSLGLFGQIILSYVIDNYGLLGMKVCRFENKKLIGVGIMILGIIVMSIY